MLKKTVQKLDAAFHELTKAYSC